MDNLISGLLAVVIFLAFTLGLAESIGEIPFFVIVIFVGAMLVTDFFQSAREGLKEDQED